MSQPDRRGAGDATSAAYRISGPVPALYHEDPLFLGLCAAFDELLAPVITAVDCFAAYLDPWLAPDGFVLWLASLVGADLSDEAGAPAEPRHRALVAGAAAGYRARGTAAGLRDLVAVAVGVPAEQVGVAESGLVTWSCTAGGAAPPPFNPEITITVVAPGQDPDVVAACARAAAGPTLPVFSKLQIKVG
jgi:phage tail-like protein